MNIMNVNEHKLKEQICDIGRRLYAKGFAAANDGNISIRLNDKEILCTPTMVSKGFLKPEDVCKVDYDGKQLAGSRKRSSEILLHLAVYKNRPDVNGVVHGYFRESDGEIFAPIDPAGSTGTVIFGINDSDWMVGRYDDSFGLTHGLLFIPPNRYVTYDFPGSTFTSLNGINQAGEIVGRYLDDGGIEHGIILRVVSTAADQSTQGVTPQRQSSQAGSLPSRSQVEEPAF